MVMSASPPSSCRTLIVTSVSAGPFNSLIASVMLMSSVSVPSISSTVSPAMTPALYAGESSRGVTMCRRLFSMVTSAPMPSNSPRTLSSKSLNVSGGR